MASHLETLIRVYLEWQGYLVRRNITVGRRAKGGWEIELDLIGFNPVTAHLVHYEPSLDANSSDKREQCSCPMLGIVGRRSTSQDTDATALFLIFANGQLRHA